MAFVEVYSSNVSVTVGNATRASELNNVATNADAVRERYVIAHHMTNTAVANEDGFHKGDRTDVSWFYMKTTGNVTAKYFCLYGDTTVAGGAVRLHLGTTTVAPTATQGGIIMVGTGAFI